MAVVFAVRFLMLLVLGIPAGVLADRVDRRPCYQVRRARGGVVAIGLALLAAAEGGTLPLWALVAGSVLLGALDAARLAAAYAYAFDLVGPALATTGLALANLFGLSGALVGSVVAGFVLSELGLVAAFVVMALVQGGIATLLVKARGHEVRAPRPLAAKGSGLRESFTLLRHHRLLRLLALVVRHRGPGVLVRDAHPSSPVRCSTRVGTPTGP